MKRLLGIGLWAMFVAGLVLPLFGHYQIATILMAISTSIAMGILFDAFASGKFNKPNIHYHYQSEEIQPQKSNQANQSNQHQYKITQAQDQHGRKITWWN